MDYTRKPVGDRGLGFFNGKDKSWQAALRDGQGVIIINESQDSAEELDQKIRGFEARPK